MKTQTERLVFYIALDNGEIIGLDFNNLERELFKRGLKVIQTSRGIYQRIKDNSRVLSTEEARNMLIWSKWEAAHPVPIRELEYVLQ